VWILGVALVAAIAWGVEERSLAIALGNSLGGELAHSNLAVPYELAALIGLWGLACWTFAANGMMLALLLREATIVVVPGGFLLLIVLFSTAAWVPNHLREIVAKSLWGAFATLLLLATFGSFAVAWRRRLIRLSTCVLSLLGWLAMTATILCWFVWLDTGHLPHGVPHGGVNFIGFLLFGSLLMLPFLPFAAAPLAVAWNRHR